MNDKQNMESEQHRISLWYFRQHEPRNGKTRDKSRSIILLWVRHAKFTTVCVSLPLQQTLNVKQKEAKCTETLQLLRWRSLKLLQSEVCHHFDILFYDLTKIRRGFTLWWIYHGMTSVTFLTSANIKSNWDIKRMHTNGMIPEAQILNQTIYLHGLYRYTM